MFVRTSGRQPIDRAAEEGPLDIAGQEGEEGKTQIEQLLQTAMTANNVVRSHGQTGIYMPATMTANNVVCCQ